MEDLAEVIRVPLRSVLQPEIIMVQSQGMARWLKLQLAQRHGICSNYQCPFPRAFSYSVFRAALPALPADPVYDPDVLIWRIMKELPLLLEETGFGELKHYLCSVTGVTMTRPESVPNGARPSSGAAALARTIALDPSKAVPTHNAAAPEDGRAPGRSLRFIGPRRERSSGCSQLNPLPRETESVGTVRKNANVAVAVPASFSFASEAHDNRARSYHQSTGECFSLSCGRGLG